MFDATAVSAPEVNSSVRSPIVPVIDSPANVATPDPFVATGVVPPRAPPPDAIAAATFTPDWLTSLPPESLSRTAGCCANATPFCAEPDGCVTITNWVAGPAVRLIVFEVAGVRPPEVNSSVRSPIVPVIDKPANVATPDPSVATGVVPPNTPPPDAIAAATLTPV